MNLKDLLKQKKQIVLAEIAQSHDGSLNYVHSFIDEVAKSGADVVKFQAHFADEESTLQDKFRTFTSFKNENRFSYWKRMQFTIDEWLAIKKHIKKRKMLFSASVFSEKAINILEKVGIDIWKIASGESLDLNLIENIVKRSRKPIFVSTGMNYQNEVDKIYRFLNKQKNFFLMMHCVSQYPCKIENIGMNILDDYKKKYKCLTGYSDHSGTIEIPLAALEKKINALELHVTFNKKIFNPDSTSSINFEDLSFICNYIKIKNKLNDIRISKNKIAKKLIKNRNLFSKSLAIKEDMKKDEIIKFSDITLKKPGTGLKWNERKKIIGARLKKNKSKNNLLSINDVQKN